MIDGKLTFMLVFNVFGVRLRIDAVYEMVTQLQINILDSKLSLLAFSHSY